MIIEDPSNGNTAAIDSSRRLQAKAISQNEDKAINIDGNYYSISFEVTPVGAGDFFFYLKNNGQTTVTITDFRMMAGAAEKVNIYRVTGTPSYVSATAAEITPRNLGSANVPSITANYDTNITGLTTDGRLFFQGLPAAVTSYQIKTTSNIIIPQGQAIAMEAVSGAILIDCVLSLSQLVG